MGSEIVARKLRNSGFLEAADLEYLGSVLQTAYEISARSDIITRGENPQNVHAVTAGMACRYKDLPDGRRSIMALLLPGDFCDLHVSILGHMDHSIGTLTDCRIIDIPRATVDDLLNHQPRVARALFWATLVDEAILREWLVNMGKRRADEQMAHLFCEIHLRMTAVGLHGENEFIVTQEQLADILGISTVHAQRVLTSLRDRELVTVQDRRISVPDMSALVEFSGFEPDYLHLEAAPDRGSQP